ncbi:dTDP-glucose 4,6-dehydratase [Anaerocolumna sedimenticola]|uniref:dTDP-glucose 4,6-dehydratase n=1 Tax=Anaerocolumna sedimenticola TaxID=2696063 RepID=A0A6P1TMI3_9FIRM|nr:dTDP-glucose 4,6-dehydratase [Anaerocolumna sedimenticola]QHQ62224.1 dTDP-glucose 4,6-dehydratase [Anaerocolumna sedimenticola]
MKTYLVTGGAGFIGSNFILYLYQTYGSEIEVINLDLLTYAGNLHYLKKIEGYPTYHFIEGDICDTKLVENIMKTYDVDYIVHFAAESHVDRSIKEIDVFAQTNIMGTINLLNCAKKSWELDSGFKTGKKFLYISTDEVYGELGAKGYFTEESPIAPRNPYSVSKASGDMMTKAFFETYGFPSVRTRCSNNFGPHQYYEKLIPLFIKNSIQNKKLPVYGDGSAVRDWIYVYDHCCAIDLVLQNGKPGNVYNIGSHNEKATLEIAKTIIEILKNEFNIKIPEDSITFVEDRKGHDRRYAIDFSKISMELGWKPSKTFDEGLKETIKWYVNNMDTVKDYS